MRTCKNSTGSYVVFEIGECTGEARCILRSWIARNSYLDSKMHR